MCEEKFSMYRRAQSVKTSFGQDYFFSAPDACNFQHHPALVMADDLASLETPLTVGTEYEYCVEAVAALKYGPVPQHSEPACATVTVIASPGRA